MMLKQAYFMYKLNILERMLVLGETLSYVKTDFYGKNNDNHR